MGFIVDFMTVDLVTHIYIAAATNFVFYLESNLGKVILISRSVSPIKRQKYLYIGLSLVVNVQTYFSVVLIHESCRIYIIIYRNVPSK